VCLSVCVCVSVCRYVGVYVCRCVGVLVCRCVGITYLYLRGVEEFHTILFIEGGPAHTYIHTIHTHIHTHTSTICLFGWCEKRRGLTRRGRERPMDTSTYIPLNYGWMINGHISTYIPLNDGWMIKETVYHTLQVGHEELLAYTTHTHT